VMAIGGIAELLWGVSAEQESLEDIAKPLTAEDAEQGDEGRPEETPPPRRPPARSRFRPGPGQTFYSPGMIGTAFSSRPQAAHRALVEEVDTIERVLADRGALTRSELARAVGARFWGPGRFAEALREAVSRGGIRRLSRTTYGPAAPARN